MPTHTLDPRKRDCAEMELLLQADLDGELDAGAAATLAQHLQNCEHCTALQQRLLQLRQMLQRESLRERPDGAFAGTLRERLQTQIPEEEGAFTAPTAMPVRRTMPVRWKSLGIFGAGAALAASLLLTFTPGMLQLQRQQDPLRDSVIAEHVRSLQADHLLDVVSTDQHTVRPWFNGKLDYVPPVRDFAQQGFALSGGRLDYLAGRPVAALVYRHGSHPINVFVWPSDRTAISTPNYHEASGYQLCTWSDDEMTFWAVSDTTAGELRKFVALWQHGSTNSPAPF